ncbi:hypothetical protein XELAEV_18025852mg [Xenopus laevis]|uniref:G-protein coupled receptors family 1 profile domain-containing protein n=1 Tax=Xenopus laevis TaxID=8355 RepID=A0A974HMA6_XENLA|nr:hypothetical protein XELAEV_18025852mg [Xenopus laevis]
MEPCTQLACPVPLLNGSFGNFSLENRSSPTNATRDPLKRNEDVAKVEVAVLALILFLALAGNICVLVAIHINRHKHSRMYFFMKHLSIADLVVALFQVLPQLIWDITFRFYAPDFVCRIVKYLQVVGMFASTYMLLLMSLDRCLAICQPLRSLHRRSDCVYVVLTWILSFLLSVPQMHIFSLKDVGNKVYDCTADFIEPWGLKTYITWITMTVYILPVMILSVCYGLISYKIWQNIRLKTMCESSVRLSSNRRATLSRVSSVRLISKAKIRTVKMTFIIVLAYIVCWTPFFFVQMWSVWDPDAPKEEPGEILTVTMSLGNEELPELYILIFLWIQKELQILTFFWIQKELQILTFLWIQKELQILTFLWIQKKLQNHTFFLNPEGANKNDQCKELNVVVKNL